MDEQRKELFEKVKIAIGITSTMQDEQIKPYFESVIEFLIDAGANETTILNNAGLIATGVIDIWNYGSGESKFSPFFMQRAIQICARR